MKTTSLKILLWKKWQIGVLNSYGNNSSFQFCNFLLNINLMAEVMFVLTVIIIVYFNWTGKEVVFLYFKRHQKKSRQYFQKKEINIFSDITNKLNREAKKLVIKIRRRKFFQIWRKKNKQKRQKNFLKCVKYAPDICTELKKLISVRRGYCRWNLTREVRGGISNE